MDKMDEKLFFFCKLNFKFTFSEYLIVEFSITASILISTE